MIKTKTAVEPIVSVLHHQSFVRLWIGQITSQLAMNTMLFLLSLLLYQKTHSNAAVSGLFLAYGVPSLVFGMAAGVIVDRLDRRLVLIVSHFGRAILTLVLLLVPDAVWLTYVIIFAHALITQLTVPAEAPLIPKLVGESTLLVPAISLFTFTFYASLAIGVIAAGPLLRLVGAHGAQLFIFTLFCVAGISVYGLPRSGEKITVFMRVFQFTPMYIAKRLTNDLFSGFRYVSKVPNLMRALALLTSTQITLILLGTLGPGFADTLLHIDVRDASIFIVGPAIFGILVGVMWIGRVGYTYKSNTLIQTGMFGTGVILMLTSLLLAMMNTFWFQHIPRSAVIAASFLLFFFFGVANSLLDVPANGILQKESGGDMRGRVYGMLSALVGGAGLVPIFVSGILADFIGVGKVIFLVGLIIFSFSVYRLRYNGFIVEG
ncbi:MAG: MFS transporter [Patescibacteria group bacterium]